MLTPPSHRWGLERTAPGEWTPHLAHWGQHLETAAPGEIPNRNPKATFMYSVNKSKAELALFLRSYSIYLFVVRVFICVCGYAWAKAHVPRLEDGSAQSVSSLCPLYLDPGFWTQVIRIRGKCCYLPGGSGWNVADKTRGILESGDDYLSKGRKGPCI